MKKPYEKPVLKVMLKDGTSIPIEDLPEDEEKQKEILMTYEDFIRIQANGETAK